MSLSLHKRAPERGFTMIEVAVAMAVLTVGLVSMALLMTNTLASTNESRFLSLASTLASEKLEDLDRWAFDDPQVAVTSGSTAGSLTADIVQNVTVGAVTVSVNYYDFISLGADQGTYSETLSGLDPGGKTLYTTTSHAPNGQITITTSANAPALIAFKRRWVIEKDTPIAAVRRITVLVTSQDPTVRPPVTFQMSMVRP